MTVSDRRRRDVLSVRRNPIVILALSISLSLLGIIVAPAYADQQHGSAVAGTEPQTECPVMVGNKLDPDIFVDYEGKRVFFCCQMCKSAFLESPEKYLPRLPQFAAATGGGAEREHDGHEDARGFSAARLIVPMGITTLSLVAIAVGLAVLFKRVKVLKPRTMLKAHKIAGASALVAGIVHALLVLLAH